MVSLLLRLGRCLWVDLLGIRCRPPITTHHREVQLPLSFKNPLVIFRGTTTDLRIAGFISVARLRLRHDVVV